MNDDDPQDVAHERFFEAVLGDHELGRPIGGTPETIKAVTRDAVWQHYQNNYRPEDLVITAAGGVDHDGLLALVEENLELAGWDKNLKAKPRSWRSQAAVVIEPTVSVNVINRPIAQANIILGSQGLVAGDDRRYAMAILNTVLGGGMSSRLFQEIREKRGLAYSVYSFNQGYSDAAAFGLYAGCSPQKATEVIKLMIAELGKVAADGITEAELALAKGNISGGLALKFESTQARMSRLSGAELTDGEFIDLDESLSRYSAVQLSDVQALAKLMFEAPKSFVAVGEIKQSLFDEFV
jgi:predicted Zn-dependent peptidase